MVSARYAFWFGVWTNILLAIGSGTVVLTNVIPDGYIPRVTATALALALINSIALTALHGYSGDQSGPLVKK